MKKVSAREQTGLMLLGVAVLGLIYVNMVIRPMRQNLRSGEQQIKKILRQIAELDEPNPVAEQQQARILKLRAEIEKMQSGLNELETNMLPISEAPQLIQEISKVIPGERLLSLKQKSVPEEPYLRVYYELNFWSDFSSAIEYLWKMESITPYVVVESLDILDAKSKADVGAQTSGLPFKLVVSVLLKQGGTGKIGPVSEVTGIQPVTRNILMERPAQNSKKEAAAKAKLKLEGITYNGADSVAIISGDVYRSGGKVGDFTVKEILQNYVILADAYKEYKLDTLGGFEVREEGSASSAP